MVHVYPLDYKSNVIWLEPFRLNFDYQMVSFVVLSYCCNHILHITLSLRAELFMFLFVMVLDPCLCLQKKKLVTTLKPLYASRFRLCKNFGPVSLFFFTALFRLRTQRMPMFWLYIVYIPYFGNPKGVRNYCRFCFQFKINRLSSSSEKHPSHHKIHKVAKLN